VELKLFSILFVFAVRQWSDKDTSHLLLLMSRMFGEFQNQRRRKKDVWEEVSKELTDEGYPWSAEDCRKKWSNMVRTFKGIQEQKLTDIDNSSTKKTKIWPFYEDVLQLFLRERADCLPEAGSVVQLLNSQGSLQSKTQRVPSEASPASGLSHMTDNHQQRNHEEITIVDYQAMINAATGNNLDLMNAQPSTSTTGVVANSCSGENMEGNVCSATMLGDKIKILSADSEAKQSSASTVANRSYFSRKRKIRNRGKSTSSFSDVFSGNPVDNSAIDKLIAVTTQQNEKLLEKLTTFHEQSIAAMKERNAILSQIFDTLQKQVDSKSTEKVYQDSLSTAISSRPINSSQISSIIATKGLTMQTDSSPLSQPTSSLQPSTSMRDLNEPMLHDTVVSVDSDPIHTIISQDVSTTGLTFHLDVPTSVSDVIDVNDPRISKGYRLENIQSDVNLAAFSATLHPTLVSVNSPKKPRSSLAKSVSVPLHTTPVNHRKIAPKRDSIHR